jgi:hypothetical protein
VEIGWTEKQAGGLNWANANSQRGAERFVGELLALVHRAGHRDQIVLRPDSGFENHTLMRTRKREGGKFSIGVRQSKQVRAVIAETKPGDRRRILSCTG